MNRSKVLLGMDIGLVLILGGLAISISTIQDEIEKYETEIEYLNQQIVQHQEHKANKQQEDSKEAQVYEMKEIESTNTVTQEDILGLSEEERVKKFKDNISQIVPTFYNKDISINCVINEDTGGFLIDIYVDLSEEVWGAVDEGIEAFSSLHTELSDEMERVGKVIKQQEKDIYGLNRSVITKIYDSVNGECYFQYTEDHFSTDFIENPMYTEGFFEQSNASDVNNTSFAVENLSGTWNTTNGRGVVKLPGDFHAVSEINSQFPIYNNYTHAIDIENGIVEVRYAGVVTDNLTIYSIRDEGDYIEILTSNYEGYIYDKQKQTMTWVIQNKVTSTYVGKQSEIIIADLIKEN